ncbi:MAG: hypothetical protein LC126_03195 [Bryobacterales bacterium]|nr:hypothetical protein [Bryobacterales bacterium]
MLGSLFNKFRTRACINRENAQKSTGPKTPAGKAASSRNALKEGFSASFAIVAPEDRQCYDEFLTGLREELQPRGVQEEDLFRRISLASWNIRRIEKLTCALYEDQGVDPLASGDPATITKLERYTRCQTLNERSYYRGVKQLRLLQDSRPSTLSSTPESAPVQTALEPEAEQRQPPSEPLQHTDSQSDKTKPAESLDSPLQNQPANQENPEPAPEESRPGLGPTASTSSSDETTHAEARIPPPLLSSNQACT